MNNFAISSSGIGEALQRSASALASAGNTIEESIGLVTAMNSVVQDPDSVGTAVKTLTMYLRAAKTEAEAAGLETDGMASSVSSLRNEIQKLTGVDIMLNDDTFKSTYQILKEIADVWDDLSDVSQSNVLNLLGGKNRANIISSLITNFEDAENAMQSALNSSGSAIKENEKFLDSIKGKINELTVSLEELSSAFISDSLIGGVIDSLRIVVDVLGGVVKMLGTLPTVIAAATLAMNAFGHSLSLLGNQRTSELVSAILNSKGSFSSTMSNLVKGLAGTFGNSAKSFWGELKTFPKTLFSHITEDRGALIAFNKEVQKGGNWLSAFKKHMLGASNEAQGMAIQIGRGEATLNGLGISATAASVKLKLAANATRILKVAIDTLANIGIMLLISAAINGLSALINRIGETAREAKEASARAKQAALEATDTVAEQISKFMELYDALNAGETTQAEFASSAYEVIEALGAQGESIDTLVAKYGDLRTAMLTIALDNLKEGQYALQGNVSDAEKKVKDALSGLFAGRITLHFNGTPIASEMQDAIEKAGYELEKSYVGASYGGKSYRAQQYATFNFKPETNDLDGITKAYEDLTGVLV